MLSLSISFTVFRGAESLNLFGIVCMEFFIYIGKCLCDFNF